MQTVVLVVHLMVVLVLIGTVLLQKSESGGFGASGGAGVMTSRGTANLLTRTTATMAAVLFVTSMFLSWYAGLDRKTGSIVAPAAQTLPIGQAPTSGGVLDALKNADAPQPAPQAPAPR